MMDDEELKKRVSLVARLYNVGSVLAGEKYKAINRIADGRKNAKKEIEFHRGCEKYHEVNKMQEEHHEMLRKFSEDKVSIRELEKKLAALESKVEKLRVASESIHT